VQRCGSCKRLRKMNLLYRGWPLLVCLLLAAGCVRLPDLSLARRAAADGDRETARWHLQQLGRRGYAAAWVDLGDMERDADRRQAVFWYRQALDRDPRAALRLGRMLAVDNRMPADDFFTVQRLLLAATGRGDGRAYQTLVSMYAAHPDLVRRTDVDRAIAAARSGGVPVPEYGLVTWYRGSGTCADHLQEIEAICRRNLDRVPACHADLVRVMLLGDRRRALERLLQQVQQGVGNGVLDPAVAVDVADTLVAERVDPGLAKSALALYAAVTPAEPRALVRQAHLIMNYPFLARPGRLLSLARQLRTVDPDQGNLLLGRIYFEGRQVARNPLRAEQYFLAVAHRLPAADYYLGRIYARGYLGRPDHRQALALLLAAARSGEARADLALAEMFVRGRGIRANPVYGLVFSSLAAGQGSVRGAALRDRLRQVATPKQRRQAATLLEQEQAWRKAGHPLQAYATEQSK